MARGYVVIESKVSDPVAYEAYKQLGQVAVATYGGRYLVRGGTAEVLEGAWTAPQRLVIIEFDSVGQAKKFYDSPEYRAARTARKDAAAMNILVVEGLPL